MAIKRTIRWTSAGLVALTVAGCSLSSDAPVIVIPPSVSTGYSHSCAVDTDGSVRCWGSNRYGELGIGFTDTLPHMTPIRVGGLPKIALISAGQFRTCGVSIVGTAYCWGNNSSGALGTGDTVTHASATPVSGAIQFASVSTGWSHTCGRSQAGVAYCWGNGAYGQLGTGNTASSSTPVPVAGSLAFTNITAGETHTCGSADGVGYCWGANAHGALGSGTPFETKSSPTAVTGGLEFVVARAGYRYSCGIAFGTAEGTFCWGMNTYGELGATTPSTCLGFSDDITACSVAPVAVQGAPALVSVALGSHHTCGVTVDGIAWCWGTNLAGELGRGTPGPSPQTAGQVSVSVAFAQIAVGELHTCGLTLNAAIYCWGGNAKGQIGDGTTTDAPTPVRVVFPP